jgi:hypothetical protein
MAYDHAEPRIVTHPKHARLERWSQRKPCIALMGEFSAGKSTLLNFLIEENLLPTQATATELPPVWFSHGDAGSYWEDAQGQRHPLDPGELHTVPRAARYLRIFSPAEILEHCDVIDTPGISDPNLAFESWRFAIGAANMVLWCTSATQAWRETERSAWVSLPQRLRRHSVLIVTRADKLVNPIDRDKVDRRLARETAGLFSDRVFMATPDAVRAKAELVEDENSPLWEQSGAAALLDRLAERFEGIYEDRARLMSRYATERPASQEPQSVMPTRVRPLEKSTPGEAAERPRPERSAAPFVAQLLPEGVTVGAALGGVAPRPELVEPPLATGGPAAPLWPVAEVPEPPQPADGETEAAGLWPPSDVPEPPPGVFAERDEDLVPVTEAEPEPVAEPEPAEAAMPEVSFTPGAEAEWPEGVTPLTSRPRVPREPEATPRPSADEAAAMRAWLTGDLGQRNFDVGADGSGDDDGVSVEPADAAFAETPPHAPEDEAVDLLPAAFLPHEAEAFDDGNADAVQAEAEIPPSAAWEVPSRPVAAEAEHLDEPAAPGALETTGEDAPEAEGQVDEDLAEAEEGLETAAAYEGLASPEADDSRIDGWEAALDDALDGGEPWESGYASEEPSAENASEVMADGEEAQAVPDAAHAANDDAMAPEMAWEADLPLETPESVAEAWAEPQGAVEPEAAELEALPEDGAVPGDAADDAAAEQSSEAMQVDRPADALPADDDVRDATQDAFDAVADGGHHVSAEGDAEDVAEEAAEGEAGALDAFAELSGHGLSEDGEAEDVAEEAAEAADDAAVAAESAHPAPAGEAGAGAPYLASVATASQRDALFLGRELAIGQGACDAPMPRELLVWREIVARRAPAGAAAEFAEMFDEFLVRVFGAAATGATTTADQDPDEIPAEDVAAGEPPENDPSGWRRLA